jgi:biotin synthase
MNCSNKKLERYRMSPEEIFLIATEVKKLKISRLFLQAGQDVHIDQTINEVVPEIKKKLNLTTILCVGERTKRQYEKFFELGIEGYILKFETSDAAIYKEITNSNQARRLQCIKWIKESGMKVGTGNMVGLPGQTIESIADDILLAVKLQPDYVSVSPFIPNEDTPLEHFPYGDLNTTLNSIALWRIALKNVLTPAVSALEKIKKYGQLQGYNAGANVITINFTPQEYRKKYSIYAKGRFVVFYEHAENTIKSAGLRLGTNSDGSS